MERDIINSRLNHQAASEAVLLHMAVASQFDKKASTAFTKMIRGLEDG